jgi:hypothetical protein
MTTTGWLGRLDDDVLDLRERPEGLFSGADERKGFVVVESRILCFLMLVGVIHWPSPSSESDNANESRYVVRDA